MKNIIIKNGIIGGIIATTFMVILTYTCYQDPKGFEPNYILGFSGMFLAFIFVFLGIKQYRDKINNGTITFGKAFQIGSLIALIISSIYVGVWLIEYYFFFPDFMEKYTEFELAHAKPENLAVTTAKMDSYKEMYKSPILIILLSYMEILPLGLVCSLISALILKKK